MRNFILIIIFNMCSFVNAQTFIVSTNIEFAEISQAQYEHAFNVREKSLYKFRHGGQKVRHAINRFLSTKKGKDRAVLHGGYESNQLACIIFENQSFIIREQLPVGSVAYFMSDEITVDTLEMFGNGDVDNDGIYYASPDFDCDEYVWCRWYALKDKNVKLMAELKDVSFEYVIPLWDDRMRFPCFFSDNKGLYYLTICDKNTYTKYRYYQIHIEEGNGLLSLSVQSPIRNLLEKEQETGF